MFEKNCQNWILHNKKKNTKKKLLDTKSLNISGVKKRVTKIKSRHENFYCSRLNAIHGLFCLQLKLEN